MNPSSATISSTTSCGNRRVGGDRHHRELAAALVVAGRLAADGGGGDVHAVLAERRPDAADHAGHVLVAEQRQVALVHLQVEALAPGLEQVRAVLLAERRPDHARAVAAGHDGDADEVGEVARRDLAALGDLDAALLGQRRRVDEVDLLVGVAGQQAVEHRERQQARVALGDPARGTRSRSDRRSRTPPAPSRPARGRARAAGTGPARPCPRRSRPGCSQPLTRRRR